MKHKMYCIFAKESLDKINGVRGKLATQAGHAYLHSYWDACTNVGTFDDTELYKINQKKVEQALAYAMSDHAYKITLVVDTVEELKALQMKYHKVCGTSLVTDAGYTVFKEPTTTCLGIGPISEANIGEDLAALKTLT